MAYTIGTYTFDQKIAALTAPSRRWSFRYDLYNGFGGYKSTIQVLGASVEHNYLADKVKRTAKFSIPTAYINTIDFTNDRLRVFALLRMTDGNWAEFPLGIFLLASSGKRWKMERRWAGNATVGKVQSQATTESVEVTGYDELLVLSEDAVLDRYVVPQGITYHEVVIDILSQAGFNALDIAYTNLTLPADMEWPPGTPKLTIINNLLTSINYTTLRFTPLGTAQSGPYIDPAASTALYTYQCDRSSVIIPGIDTELDLFGIPNVFVAYVSEPDRPPLRSVFINDDATSITSTVSRGRQIVQIVEPDRQSGEDEQSQPPDQATLDAKVAQVAAVASQQYETAKFSTGLMPFHDNGDVFWLNYGEEPYKFREVSWSMDLSVGGVMQHEFRRVVTV